MSPKKRVSTNRNSLKDTSIEQSITQSSSSSSSLNLDPLDFSKPQPDDHHHSITLESNLKPTSSEKRKIQLRSAQRTFSQRRKQREKLTSSQLVDATNLNREMRSTIARSQAEREVLRQYVSKEVLEEAKKRFPIPTNSEPSLQPLPGYHSPNLDSFNDLLITPLPNRFHQDDVIDVNDENSIPQGSSKTHDRDVIRGKDQGLGDPALSSQDTFWNSNYPGIKSDQLVSDMKPILENRTGSDEQMELEETEPTLMISSNVDLSNGFMSMNEGTSATDYHQFETCGSPPELQFDEGWGEFWEIHYDEIEEEEKEEVEEVVEKKESQEKSKVKIQNPEDSKNVIIKKGLTGEEKKTEVMKGHDSALEGKRGGNENERNVATQEAGSQNDLAQPMPKNWRPPNLTKGESVRQMLKGTQAWGRLMSHPLAAQCDKDELARALQKQAKCANGSPVVSRDDVMKIWLSIPGRVKGKRAGYKLGEDGRGDVDLGD
ncbi:uncharacterized protein MELLADRAFT_109351 [Melampsora larici-populina 98AG31]|uniref:Transcription factor PAP1 domain-containing protein n=1 Tax=Melampsora larici-populina (strain 98AG31 / pathotype 3-4-7) TaxID=747676 RepID=F4RW66_MELLP|nr:uncharacterized protein MELLADRAFT_109351 [Melampsora larici-populina 98AG31]EGG03372.1 hypothetical protein MELLADRAFT_109351 [Melampsora larici-populina 98AG31]